MRKPGALIAVALVAGIAVILALLWFREPARESASAARPDSAAVERARAAREDEVREAPQFSDERSPTKIDVAGVGDVQVQRAGELGRIELEVLVVRASSLRPVAGARVLVWDEPNALDQGEFFERELAHGRIDTLFAHCAEPLLADEFGRVSVSVAEHGSMLIGLAPGAFGTLLLNAATPPPRRIVLRNDFDLRAKVVDDDDRPVADVHVTARQLWNSWFEDVFAVETDADGLAVLRHVGSKIGEDIDHEFLCAVTLAEALDPPVEARFELRSPPVEPVLLTLPPSGSCTIHLVDAAGEPYLRPTVVEVRFAPAEGLGELPFAEFADQTPALASRESLESGFVDFDHVTPGRDLIVTVRREGVYVGQSVRAAGPTLAGQHVELTVSIGTNVTTLAGRALDSSGVAMAGVRLRARLESANRERGVWLGVVRSDATGRFEFDVEPERARGEAFELVVTKFTNDIEEPHRARRALPAFVPTGTLELGDFVLEQPAVLAAGRVLDSAGQPAAGALVSLRWQTYDDPEFQDIGLARLRTRCDAAGRFTLRGDGKPLAIGIDATLDEASSEVREVIPGDSNVTLILGASGALAGTLLLDPSVSHRSLSIMARFDDPNAVGTEAEGAETSVPLDESGEFVLRGLRPGVYTLIVRNSDSWDELATVEDLLVRADEITRDPRINPFDLRDRFRALRLMVVDELQAPVDEGLVLTYAALPSDAEPTWTWLDHGRVTLMTDGNPVRVAIHASGFLLRHVSNVVEDQTIELKRGPSVRLMLAPGLSAPEPPLYLSARFTSIESEDEPWTDDGIEFDTLGVALGGAKRIGASRLLLSLAKRDEHTYVVVDFDESTERIVELRDIAGEQVIEVSFKPGAIDEYARYLNQ